MNIKKILVIDDDNNFLNAISYILKNENYEVILSSNAKEALNILNNDKNLQVLLIDLKMPDLSGIGFLKKIINFKRSLQRIVITAHDNELGDKVSKNLKIF